MGALLLPSIAAACGAVEQAEEPENAVSAVTANSRPVGDFDGNRRSDILWRHSTDGGLRFWLMNGGAISDVLFGTVPLEWRIDGLGDFNGDGKGDILWRQLGTGTGGIWLMDGTTRRRAVGLSVGDSNWEFKAAGDFNADGTSDILWRNSANGQNALWLMGRKGTPLSTRPVNFVTDMNWRIEGAGDFDGDGKSDILWRNALNGTNGIWLMDGSVLRGALSIPEVTDLEWKVAAIGDFSGDRKSDIFWRHARTGRTSVWFMSGQEARPMLGLRLDSLLSTVVIDPSHDADDLNWTLEATGDYDGNRISDVLWRHQRTGSTHIWMMNGASEPVLAKVESPTTPNDLALDPAPGEPDPSIPTYQYVARNYFNPGQPFSWESFAQPPVPDSFEEAGRDLLAFYGANCPGSRLDPLSYPEWRAVTADIDYRQYLTEAIFCGRFCNRTGPGVCSPGEFGYILRRAVCPAGYALASTAIPGTRYPTYDRRCVRNP